MFRKRTGEQVSLWKEFFYEPSGDNDVIPNISGRRCFSSSKR